MSIVLVIDDSPLVRDLIKQALSNTGVEVVEASNGKEALQLLKRFSPDLILLDVMMPEMDGIMFIQELNDIKGYKDIPIIVLTALSERYLLDKIKAFSVKDIVAKPFSPTKLRNLVQRYISRNKV